MVIATYARLLNEGSSSTSKGGVILSVASLFGPPIKLSYYFWSLGFSAALSSGLAGELAPIYLDSGLFDFIVKVDTRLKSRFMTPNLIRFLPS